MIKIIITGGRNMTDYTLVCSAMRGLPVKPDCVITGGCTGADALVARWARDGGVHVMEVKALWGYYGNSAGPIRNKFMASLGADLLVAFPGGKGTASMKQLAITAGIQVLEIRGY